MTKLRPFTMPKWGIEMTEGVIAEWMVEEGKAFKKGDLLALIETDKITNEVEAEYDGLFARLIATTGETYTVGQLLGVVAGLNDKPADADIDNFIADYTPSGGAVPKGGKPRKEAASKQVQKPVKQQIKPVKIEIGADVNISPVAISLAQERGVDVSLISGSGKGGRITYQDVMQASLPEVSVGGGTSVDITPVGLAVDEYYASPLAKRLAVQHGVDLAHIKGTGPKGRICKDDVLAQFQQPLEAPTPQFVVSGAVDVVKMSPMRKAIAKSLSHSKSTIPHFYLRQKVRIDAILGLRLQAKAATGEAPSINDYIIRACAVALSRHPNVNIQVHGDEIHRFADADISLAVATDKGLITPILRAANGLSVSGISRQVKQLAEKARAGKLQAEEFQGGSFSISNLGMFGIDQFDAIINPPQGAILAVGSGVRQPIEIENALAFATIVELSLSCDHRAIDGTVGAEFMCTLKSLIENPQDLMA